MLMPGPSIAGQRLAGARSISRPGPGRGRRIPPAIPFVRTHERSRPMLSNLSRLLKPVVNFCNDESGPTAVEYAVMLALIIVVCISAITALGSNANNTFSYVGGQVGATGGS